jgi:hypothetical protein
MHKKVNVQDDSECEVKICHMLLEKLDKILGKNLQG